MQDTANIREIYGNGANWASAQIVRSRTVITMDASAMPTRHVALWQVGKANGASNNSFRFGHFLHNCGCFRRWRRWERILRDAGRTVKLVTCAVVVGRRCCNLGNLATPTHQASAQVEAVLHHPVSTVAGEACAIAHADPHLGPSPSECRGSKCTPGARFLLERRARLPFLPHPSGNTRCQGDKASPYVENEFEISSC